MPRRRPGHQRPQRFSVIGKGCNEHPAPVQTLRKRGALRRCQTHHAIVNARPLEATGLTPLGHQPKPVPAHQTNLIRSTRFRPEQVDYARRDRPRSGCRRVRPRHRVPCGKSTGASRPSRARRRQGRSSHRPDGLHHGSGQVDLGVHEIRSTAPPISTSMATSLRPALSATTGANIGAY